MLRVRIPFIASNMIARPIGLITGMSSNVRKSEQLGMPFGTAAQRLRKQVMFMLVREAKRDVCYRCDLPIESDKDLTIEHKDPWLDVDPDLFWDLSNIAFSHSWCNRPHRNQGNRKPRKIDCGTRGAYRKGCRCESCRAWKSSDNARWS